MKKFIFVTNEGKSTAPSGKPIETKQIIGIVENVETEDEALKKLLQENSWIFDAEFNVAEFVAYEIL